MSRINSKERFQNSFNEINVISRDSQNIIFMVALLCFQPNIDQIRYYGFE